MQVKNLSKETVVWLSQTSKPFDILILAAADSNNQPVPRPIGVADNWIIYLSVVGFDLEIYQRCATTL